MGFDNYNLWSCYKLSWKIMGPVVCFGFWMLLLWINFHQLSAYLVGIIDLHHVFANIICWLICVFTLFTIFLCCHIILNIIQPTILFSQILLIQTQNSRRSKRRDIPLYGHNIRTYGQILTVCGMFLWSCHVAIKGWVFKKKLTLFSL